MSHEPLRLHCFPSADLAFRELAERALAALPAPNPRDLQAALQEKYPGVSVHPREPLAHLSGGPVWYVHRPWPGPDVKPRRVLIIEDDADLARMMSAAIASEGTEVRAARDGRAGLEIATTWDPEAIILDLGLPVLDGVAFAAEYQETGRRATIVVVSAAPGVSEASAKIGADAWLPKPFELEQLLAVVQPPADRASLGP